MTIVKSKPLTVIPNKRNHENHQYALIELGTPSTTIPLLIDTSSSHPYINPKYLSDSSTFQNLTCMDEEFCDVCLDNKQSCAWNFACEQSYIMAEDIIHDISDSLSSEEDIYLVFGYKVIRQSSSDGDSKVNEFSMARQQNRYKGGVLSLNREHTSFGQQLSLHYGIEAQFAHYFNSNHSNTGKLAFGDDDVEVLMNELSISEDEITWIDYLDEEEPSMYRVHLEEIILSDNDGENEVIFLDDGDDSTDEKLNILTFDTDSTGISMNYDFKNMTLEFLTKISNVRLTSNPSYDSYPYCIDSDDDDELEDIFEYLPNIEIRLSSNWVYIISPQQYLIQLKNTNHTIYYPFCLDISFDWDEGICLGSLPMENYLIIYNDTLQAVGIVDKNENHYRHDQQNQAEFVILSDNKKEFVFMLSMVLVALLVFAVLVALICVGILKKNARDRRERETLTEGHGGVTRWNYKRRKSVTIEDDMLSPPRHVVVNAEMKKREKHLDVSKSGSSSVNVSMSSSLSPLQYYDGNIKSIVYDRIIQPWSLEDNVDAI